MRKEGFRKDVKEICVFILLEQPRGRRRPEEDGAPGDPEGACGYHMDDLLWFGVFFSPKIFRHGGRYRGRASPG